VQNSRSEWGKLAGVGFEFAVSILLFGAIGWWLDGKLGTEPWLLIVGFGLGFAVGLWLLIKVARKMFHD
jgi:F0F1-type ATP synthase assembly protein I